MAEPVYLSGNRIQGRSDDISSTALTPTVAKTIFQGAGLESRWVDNSEDISYNATTDVIDFEVSGSGNVDSYATFDLRHTNALNGSDASDTAWVLRFKLDITTYTLGNASSSALVIGISNQGTTNGSASQNGIGLEVGIGVGNDTLYRLQTANGGVWARGSAEATFTETPAVETTYVEVKRTSATNVTVSLYSDSAYSTLQEAESITNVSGTTSLRYLSVKSDTQAEANKLIGTVSEFELWNGVTSAHSDKSKASITNMPTGTRYEETDTKKIFIRGVDLVDGDGLKCYIKFDDASGNHTNKAGSVTGNDTLGSAADITPTGTGTIDYQTTGLPSKLGTGAEYPSTSSTSGRHGIFGSSVSQFNFLHGGGTSTTFTICFWAKYPTTAYNNQVILRSNEGDTGAGTCLYHYMAPGGSNGDGAFRLFIAKQGGGNNQAIQGYSNAGFFLFDDAWHFYSFQCNWAGSPILLFRRDYSDANQSFAQNSSNVPDAITQDSPDPLCFRQDSSQRNVYVPPTAEYAEMSIWDRRLTDAEVLKIYNSGNGFQLDTGLDAWKEKGT